MFKKIKDKFDVFFSMRYHDPALQEIESMSYEEILKTLDTPNLTQRSGNWCVITLIKRLYAMKLIEKEGQNGQENQKDSV